MKLTHKYLLSCIGAALILGLALPGLVCAADDDPIFRAMNDELNRSMHRLVMKDVPAPYFLSYRVRDFDLLTVQARYGAVVDAQQRHDRFLYIDLRVGSPELDNTNYYSDWEDVWDGRVGIPEEDQYDALRHALWYNTDQVYKTAAEALAGKKAYLQTHPVKEQIPDFALAEPLVSMGDPVKMVMDQAAWEQRVRQAAAPLERYPGLEDWTVELTARAMNQWYLNSEGSRHLKGDVYYVLEISACAQALDGQRLTGFREYAAAREDDLPDAAALDQAVRELAGELTASAQAEALDEYVGPVLFTDFATAQFVAQMVVDPMSLAREPLVAQDWMSQYLQAGKLAGRVKRRILPEFVTITDQPNLKEWNGITLVGYQPVDDEGVAGQDITIVEKGRLVTLPTNRQPLKKVPESNGHARSNQLQRTFPGISNLIVSAEKPLQETKLVAELRRLCREQDLEYGLLVKSLEESRYTDRYTWGEPTDDMNEPMLSAPVAMYRVYAKDGRTEPVRGLKFDEVNVQTLRGIAAMGKEARVWNLAKENYFAGTQYPAAIITPSILVEEMELKAASEYEPQPVAGNPMFEK